MHPGWYQQEHSDDHLLQQLCYQDDGGTLGLF
ncbi:hypothetical protein GKIL_3158 [Gloeobacter kilaueensis JS1]|uniref:Uncharacterized protein n=1 Tax=Gloeobacter kilaueensis (strain ATCC BAA-2537 / CCAP 1431/1 / ULC 316 / JS1) TaxID=1183438 RepID=U5QP99_GLOK1|nr:hypothetical protein GKIL_3158 [Gloeobacter kilaueensis JS1]